MADFDKINIDAVSYNVKDTTARQQIAVMCMCTAQRTRPLPLQGGELHA